MSTWRSRLVRRCWREGWNVGVMALTPPTLLEGGLSQAPCWLFTDIGGRHHADPFLLQNNHRLFVLCERFDWEIGRGEIVAGELIEIESGWRLVDVRSVLKAQSYHYSYPCLLQHDGEVFMIPETANRGRVELYRARRVPDDWVREATLLDGFAGIDATPFHAGGRFWMFAGRRGPRENSELHAFHAPALTGPWRPVQTEPVVLDAGHARMAGNIISWQDSLIRPAQDCRGTYGRRIVWRKIGLLEETAYREETIAVIEPLRAGAYNQGLHTINFAAGIAVIDGKRYYGLRRSLGPTYAAMKRCLADR